jgi:putative transposase
VEHRQEAVRLIDVAVTSGARCVEACRTVGISIRTCQRWKNNPDGDRRRGPVTRPANKLSEEEKAEVIKIATCEEYRDLSPAQVVPSLADRGRYVASESTFYRILKAQDLLCHRGRARPAEVKKPQTLLATAPNQVWSWDITYLKSAIAGVFFYAYVILDIYSRKIVGAQVFEAESSGHASRLITTACLREKIARCELTLHSDNGSPMKGATLLATLQKLGVVPSFSRPRVSDDNPYSEALFRTLKYCPEFPTKPFETLEAAQAWLERFVDWYNNHHLHSGIKFVTPADRHLGKDLEILQARKQVYEKTRAKVPSRWSKNIRNWNPITEVSLNPLKNSQELDMKLAA